MSRHKRWSAKARKAELRRSPKWLVSDGYCKQCRAHQAMRAPIEHDGPRCVSRGRCGV